MKNDQLANTILIFLDIEESLQEGFAKIDVGLGGHSNVPINLAENCTLFGGLNFFFGKEWIVCKITLGVHIEYRAPIIKFQLKFRKAVSLSSPY